MLKVFRDNLRRLHWILWFVIAVFVLLVFVDFRNLRDNPGSSQSTAVTVAGREISYGEYRAAYEQIDERFRSIYGESYTPEIGKQLGIANQALQAVVGQALQLDDAAAAGFAATPFEIRERIKSIPALRDERGRFVGYDKYKQVLTANRLDVEAFERNVAEEILLNKYRGALVGSTWVSDTDVEQRARTESESADIRWFALKSENIKDTIPVADSELNSYFQDHRGEYSVPERRKVAYLVVNQNVVRAAMQIPDEDLRRYYDEHLDEFISEEQVRARHILKFTTDARDAAATQAELEALKARIAGGASFADLATAESEDEATKSRGGDLGFFPRGRMTKQFEDAAFDAAEGEVVGPIENQLGPRTGYHLIRVEGRRPGGTLPFEQATNRIRVKLLNERARTETEQRAQSLLAAVRPQADLNEASLREIADQNQVTLETPEPLGREDTIPGIGRNAAFSDAVFTTDVGKVAAPVRIAAGWAVPVVLASEPARLPELAEVQERVRTNLTTAKKRELAMERLSVAARDMQSGSLTLDAVAARFAVPIQEAVGLRHGSPIAQLGREPAILKAAFELEQGAVGGPISTANGAVLFQVTSRTYFDPIAFAQQKDELRDRLRSTRASSLLQSVLEQRRARANVRLAPSLTATFELESADTP